jgi:hypothetical protein
MEEEEKEREKSRRNFFSKSSFIKCKRIEESKGAFDMRPGG